MKCKFTSPISRVDRQVPGRMKIAITADVHLVPGEKPERLNALSNIFEQLEAEGIGVLIIAGDLFDEDVRELKDFEELCRKHRAVKVHVIPGNHDPSLSSGDFTSETSENVTVHDTVDLEELDENCTTPFLFVPYCEEKNMGEQIVEKKPQLDEVRGKWILVSHGNFMGGVKERDPYETGIYMELYQKDLDIFRPKTSFLGHIHLVADLPPGDLRGEVVYPGSPCGLDISETGRRRFLIYDTENEALESRDIKTDVLFFKESFLVIPGEDEISRLQEEIEERIRSWDLGSSESEKVLVRVEARGYARNRKEISEVLRSGFSAFRIDGDKGPDMEAVQSDGSDDALAKVAAETLKAIDELDWDFSDPSEPDRDEVKEEALHAIYQVGK